jgi:hypothetical protein
VKWILVRFMGIASCHFAMHGVVAHPATTPLHQHTLQQLHGLLCMLQTRAGDPC